MPTSTELAKHPFVRISVWDFDEGGSSDDLGVGKFYVHNITGASRMHQAAVESSGDDDPPTRRRAASRRDHSRMAVAPTPVAPTVVASAFGAAAAAARVGWKSRPACVKEGEATMLANVAKAATAPSLPP